MSPLKTIKKIFLSNAAVYISEDFIDVARADAVIGGMKITSLRRFPVRKKTGSALSSDISADLDKDFAAIFPDRADRPYRIAMNIRNNHLILRRFTIRSIPGKEMAQAVAFEAQKYIPSLIDNLTYAYKIHSRRQGMQEIVFAAAETKNIREITDYFQTNNILPSTIEPVPALLARSLNLNRNLKKRGTYIFIHYEPFNKVILCEISYRSPYFFREIILSPDDEREKDAELSYPTLKSAWPHIERDVIGGIEYLRKEANEKVEKIFISGFRHSPDDASISEEFGLPFERPDLSFFKGMESADKDRYLPLLMLLHDLQRGPFLNVAPADIVKSDLWVLKTVATRSFAAFAAILLIHALLAGANAQKARAVAREKTGLAVSERVNPNATGKEIMNHARTVVGRAEFIDNLMSKRHFLTEKLTRLGEILPDECWVDKIDYSNQGLGEKRGISLAIKGFALAGPAGGADPNKISESIKQDKKIMSGFKEAELTSLVKKEFYGKEIAEFEITLK